MSVFYEQINDDDDDIPRGELIALPRLPTWWGGSMPPPRIKPTPLIGPLGLDGLPFGS